MIPDTNNSNKDGTIVYQATIADDCMKYTVEFNPTSTSTGTAITGTGTMAPQSIYEGVATPLTTNTFTAPSGYYFVGWNTAQDGTGTSYTDGQSVTDLTTAGNTITLYAQWTDCLGGNICYSANVANASDVTGSMGNQSISDSDTSATLWASNFKRDGYGFAGWNTKADGTGTNYGPNQTIAITAGQYRYDGLRLYAKWVESAGNLQNWTCPDNTTMPIGEVTALKDTRDNNVYAVAKLADGQCWMIENLRVDNTSVFSSTTTHNPAISGLSAPVNPYVTPWCNANTAGCDNQTMLAVNNTSTFTSNVMSEQGNDIYSYGNNYNWYSATVGRGRYETNTNNSSVNGDICPVGWRLPTGGQNTVASGRNGDYYKLITTLAGGAPNNTNSGYAYYDGASGVSISNTLRNYPNNFTFSGYVSDSSIDARGVRGYYWASTANANNYAYYMRFDMNGAYPGTSFSYKYYGFTIRCVNGT